jgi:hypothetical protein
MGFRGTWSKLYHEHTGKQKILKSGYELLVQASGDKGCTFHFRLENGNDLPISVDDCTSSSVSFDELVRDGEWACRYYGVIALGTIDGREVLLGVIWRRCDPQGPDEDMGTFTAVKKPGDQDPPDC